MCDLACFSVSVIISVAVTLGCHCMMAFTFWEPFVAMVSCLFSLVQT